MNVAELFSETAAEARTMVRARVRKVAADGRALCEWDEGGVSCEILQTGDGPPLALAPGDVVLVWFSDADREEGVILGRLGPHRAAKPKPEPAPAPKAEPTLDELVIEARSQLTLRCGDGSITLRGDGKVLIKGKDLVSHARRTNRIKGGAVAIN
jgi:hypothetical protein